MPSVILLTGSEIRHAFFRKFLAKMPEIKLIRTYCETPIAIENLIKGEEKKDLRSLHLQARTQAEEDFFELFVDSSEDLSHPVSIQRGTINDEAHVKDIIRLNPDYLVAYGCSIIKSDLIEHFEGRFINLHLGLSPYYRGSATNFWPLVNNEPQFVGATFMHIDAGIDTGQIIHQLRARIVPFDTVHSIGNRLIKDACEVMGKILRRGIIKESFPLPEESSFVEKVYRNKDYSEESVRTLYNNFNEGMTSSYLENMSNLQQSFPIVDNHLYHS
jgi:phosphoribosylglycinamide formyltransferase 1